MKNLDQLVFGILSRATLTGSRFFGGEHAESDYDFFAVLTEEEKRILKLYYLDEYEDIPISDEKC